MGGGHAVLPLLYGAVLFTSLLMYPTLPYIRHDRGDFLFYCIFFRSIYISRISARTGKFPWLCPHSNYSRAFPSTATPPHTNQAASGLGLGFRVGVVAAVSRSRKQSHRGAKSPLRLLTIPFIKTASFYAGTSQQVRLRGQIYASCPIYYLRPSCPAPS